MAKTVINLSDPVTSLVTKTNTISDNLGDIAIITTGDSNVVDAINTVKDQIDSIDGRIDNINGRLSLIDSAPEIRAFISVTDAGGDGSLSYSSSTGVITYVGPSASEVKAHFQSDSSNGITFNSSSGSFSIAPNAVSYTKFRSRVSLVIYDSTGSAVKTLYSPGA